MAIKGMLALVLVAVFAAIGAVVFSLDSMAASRDENDATATVEPAAAHDAARQRRRDGAPERG